MGEGNLWCNLNNPNFRISFSIPNIPKKYNLQIQLNDEFLLNRGLQIIFANDLHWFERNGKELSGIKKYEDLKKVSIVYDGKFSITLNDHLFDTVNLKHNFSKCAIYVVVPKTILDDISISN